MVKQQYLLANLFWQLLFLLGVDNSKAVVLFLLNVVADKLPQIVDGFLLSLVMKSIVEKASKTTYMFSTQI